VNAANDSLRVNGVSRDASDARTLVIYFNERPSDDDMRRIHDLLREGSPATAPGRVPLRMLTEDEVLVVVQRHAKGDVLRLTYDKGPYEVTTMTFDAMRLTTALVTQAFTVNGLPLGAADGEVEGAKNG
jgi:hypothetical protein